MRIAFEGIDGAGKGTQTSLLKQKVESLGMSVAMLSFPRYRETVFGQCVAAYLNGQFGDLASVPAQSAALLYAGDRFESLDTIQKLSSANDILILDRYAASNLAHQGARVTPEQREALLTWITHMEYTVFGLPRAELTIYLDMPTDIAATLIQKKQRRSYTAETADLHEKDLAYLNTSRAVYQMLAETNTDSTWYTVQCTYPDGELRSAAEIHAAIWNAIQERVCKSSL